MIISICGITHFKDCILSRTNPSSAPHCLLEHSDHSGEDAFHGVLHILLPGLPGASKMANPRAEGLGWEENMLIRRKFHFHV